MSPRTSQLIAAWCGPGFIVTMLFSFWLIGFLPPNDPAASATEIQAFYQDHPFRARMGLLIFMWGSALYLPFAGALTYQMYRAEKGVPVWTAVQVMASAGNVVTLTAPTLAWGAAAFRLDRDPELIQLINDMAWVPFVGMTSPFLMVPIAIAMVAFMDKSENPVFPRWSGFYNLFVMTMLLPGGLIIFFQDGPFAWDGLMGFWIPLTDWGIWYVVTCILLIKAIKRQNPE